MAKVQLAMGLAAIAALVGACQSLVGIEDSPALPSSGGAGGASGAGASGGAGGAGGSGGAAGDASTGGSGGTEGGADAGCPLAQPPSPPSGAAPGGDLDVVIAIRQVDFGDQTDSSGPTWKHIGYDLDQLCTCTGDTAGSCKGPKKTVCDGIDGRDNALGEFLYQIRNVFKITQASSEQLSQKIETGTNTILVRIRGYNGTPNDAEVEVSWYASADFDETNAVPPKWDGTDEWSVLATSLLPQAGADGGAAYDVAHPKYVDKLAYVTNGVLAASLPAGSFALATDQSIDFTAAFLTAKLTKKGSSYSLEEGVLAGITSVGQVLGALASVKDPVTDKPLCTDNLIYGGVKNLVCGFPDMSVLGSPSKPCDHFSLGIKMRGEPAKLGPVTVNVLDPSPCAPGKHPKDDSC
ncbi:MAG: hypothetical protein IT377_01035 [Polyangiaceae bacterium]|nr:hypothetical protein [Polyangiaceae bacterium]